MCDEIYVRTAVNRISRQLPIPFRSDVCVRCVTGGGQGLFVCGIIGVFRLLWSFSPRRYSSFRFHIYRLAARHTSRLFSRHHFTNVGFLQSRQEILRRHDRSQADYLFTDNIESISCFEGNTGIGRFRPAIFVTPQHRSRESENYDLRLLTWNVDLFLIADRQRWSKQSSLVLTQTQKQRREWLLNYIQKQRFPRYVKTISCGSTR